MNPNLLQAVLYLGSFGVIWLGAELIVKSVSKLSRRWKLPAFTVAFFVLGLLTSLPELAIGITAIRTGQPEIFVGNLIGGVIVMFLFVIPLLSLANQGLRPPKLLDKRSLLLILVVCFAPVLLTVDQQVHNWEGGLAVLLYATLFFLFSKQQGVLEKITASFQKQRINGWAELAKIALGIVLLIVASDQIVRSTMFFADQLNIAPFFMSLIVVSIGTNIPEISLIVSTFFLKKKEIAFADYLGSASSNTLLFGLLTLAFPAVIILPNHFLHRLLFILVGLIAFFVFLRSDNRLSRRESLLLIMLYVTFVITEFLLAE